MLLRVLPHLLHQGEVLSFRDYHKWILRPILGLGRDRICVRCLSPLLAGYHPCGVNQRMAFLHYWAAGRWSYGSTVFWRQFGSSAQDDKHIGAGARRGAGLRDLAYGVSKLFSQPCVRLVALRVLWTARAARRPFLFWIGRRARSGCAGPPGPRPLAPPRMRPSESKCGMMAAPRGPSRLLCGAALYPRNVRRVGLPQPSRSRVDATGRRCSGGEASGESREAGEAGGAQAAFGRFWVAGRIGSWSVLVFGAKWIISGRQRVRCGRPACITNACLWHNLRLVHRFEDYRGARIINTNILMHG